MDTVSILVLLAGIVGIPVGLKVAILLQWHRNGWRWPDEDPADYVKHSPRFDHVGGRLYRDTNTDEYVAVPDDADPVYVSLTEDDEVEIGRPVR